MLYWDQPHNTCTLEGVFYKPLKGYYKGGLGQGGGDSSITFVGISMNVCVTITLCTQIGRSLAKKYGGMPYELYTCTMRIELEIALKATRWPHILYALSKLGDSAEFVTLSSEDFNSLPLTLVMRGSPLYSHRVIRPWIAYDNNILVANRKNFPMGLILTALARIMVSRPLKLL